MSLKNWMKLADIVSSHYHIGVRELKNRPGGRTAVTSALGASSTFMARCRGAIVDEDGRRQHLHAS
jgi:hypothetical protein